MPSLRYTEQTLGFLQWVWTVERVPAKVYENSKVPPLKIMYHVDGSSEPDSEQHYIGPYTRLDCLDGKGLTRPCNV
ncbi:MAG: hypothetical protein C5B60_08780 [Chloroflexi bacterium]|nr:MAG: hypothetical protein C5B60_08780 [Chloroflexota bacterium]